MGLVGARRGKEALISSALFYKKYRDGHQQETHHKVRRGDRIKMEFDRTIS
jgi:hypothetical protein